jgi:hypothetical protein
MSDYTKEQNRITGWVGLFCGVCGLGAGVGFAALGSPLALPLLAAGAYKLTVGAYQAATGVGDDE